MLAPFKQGRCRSATDSFTSVARTPQIAGFIFGKNTAVGAAEAEKVAMTTPVRLEMQVHWGVLRCGTSGRFLEGCGCNSERRWR